MKIRVQHRKLYGRDLFFATDMWTKDLFKIFKPTTPQVSVSLQQIRGLKELGFEVVMQKTEAPEEFKL